MTADAHCLRIHGLRLSGDSSAPASKLVGRVFLGQTEWILSVRCHAVEGFALKKHAMALGYFFLAVFCVFTSAHCFRGLHLPLWMAALAATLAGVGYLLSACAVTLQAGKTWLTHWFMHMFHLAQQPPVRESKLGDEHGM